MTVIPITALPARAQSSELVHRLETGTIVPPAPDIVAEIREHSHDPEVHLAIVRRIRAATPRGIDE